MNNFTLSERLKAHVTDTHVDFYGGPFSSFSYQWPFWAPFRPPAYFDGHFFLTREHFFQAAKIGPGGNRDIQQKIRTAPTPNDAKRLGRKCTLREDWEQVKFSVMVQGILYQVVQHQELLQLLLETGDREIREDSSYDDIWGYRNLGKGPGQNLLGKAWMAVRENVQAEMQIAAEKEGRT